MMSEMWIMWKSYPPQLWKTGCTFVRNVDIVENVEKLSTMIVEKPHLVLGMWITACNDVRNVDNVEKLSTIMVDNFFAHASLLFPPSYPH